MAMSKVSTKDVARVVRDVFGACGGGDDGYAYMYVFQSKSEHVRNRVRKILGPFPALRDVVSEVLLRFDVAAMVPKPTLVRGLWCVGVDSELYSSKAFVTQFAFEKKALYHMSEEYVGEEEDEGYCYMRWFASCGVRKQNAARKFLGAYPSARAVVMRLHTALDCDVSIETPTLQDGVWHVMPGAMLVPASQVIGQLMNDLRKIGGRRSGSRSYLRESLARQGLRLVPQKRGGDKMPVGEGYCYSSWFAHLDPEDRLEVLLSLGAYPLVSDVVLRLIAESRNDVPVPVAREGKGGVLHVDPRETVTVRITDIVKRHSFDTRRIGGMTLGEQIDLEHLLTTGARDHAMVQAFLAAVADVDALPIVEAVQDEVIAVVEEASEQAVEQIAGAVLETAATDVLLSVAESSVGDMMSAAGAEVAETLCGAAASEARETIVSGLAETCVEMSAGSATAGLVTAVVDVVPPVLDTVVSVAQPVIRETCTQAVEEVIGDAADCVVGAVGVAVGEAAQSAAPVIEEACLHAMEEVVGDAADSAVGAVGVAIGDAACVAGGDSIASNGVMNGVMTTIRDATVNTCGAVVAGANSVARSGVEAVSTATKTTVAAGADVARNSAAVISKATTASGEAVTKATTASLDATRKGAFAIANTATRVAKWTAETPVIDNCEKAVVTSVLTLKEKGTRVAYGAVRFKRNLILGVGCVIGGYFRYSLGIVIWVRLFEVVYMIPRHGKDKARQGMAVCGSDMLTAMLLPGATVNLAARAMDTLIVAGGEPASVWDFVTFGVKLPYVDYLVDLPWYMCTRIFVRPVSTVLLAGSVCGGVALLGWYLRKKRSVALRNGDAATVATIDVITASPLAQCKPVVMKYAAIAAGAAATVLAIKGMAIGGSSAQDGAVSAGGDSASNVPVASDFRDRGANTNPPITPSATTGAASSVMMLERYHLTNQPMAGISATLKAARIEADQVSQQIAYDLLLQRAASQPESFTAEVSHLVDVTKPRLAYHPEMSQQHVERITKAFPSITFYPDTNQSMGNCHEVAALARRAMTWYVYDSLKAWEPAPYLDISDIGGNEALSFEKDTRVHYCRLVVDVRDAARRVNRSMALDEADKRRPGLKAIFRDNGPRMCTNGAEKCPYMTPLTCEIHVYDIPMKTRAKIFDRKQVVKHMQVVHFYPGILVSDSGTCDTADYSFEKTKDGMIRFWFKNSLTVHYIHKYEDYIAPIRDSVMVTPQGRVYYIEKSKIVMGQIVITYTAAMEFDAAKLVEDARMVTMVPMEWEGYRVFPYLDVVPGDPTLTGMEGVVKYDAAPVEVLERAMRVAINAHRKTDFDIAVSEQLQQLNSKRVINGTTMRAESQVTQETLRNITSFAIAYALVTARKTRATTNALEQMLPSGGMVKASVLDVLKTNCAFIRDVVDAFWPENTFAQENAINRRFLEDHAKTIAPNLATYLTKAPDQVFESIMSLQIPAGVPVVHFNIPAEYIRKQQLSFEYARRLLQTNGEKPRQLLTMSGRAYKTQSRIHATPSDVAAPIRFKNTLQGRRCDEPPPERDALVKVRGDGYCSFRAVLIAAGVRYFADEEFGEPAMHPEAVRKMLHGLWTDCLDIYDTLPGTTDFGKIFHATNCTELEITNTLETMKSSETWASVAHLNAMCRIINADLIAHYNNICSWLITLDTTPQDPRRYVTLELQVANKTHADAYRAELEGAEDMLWYTFFSVLRRRHPHSVRYTDVATHPEGRQVAKLMELLKSVAKPSGHVLEIGAAPGAWTPHLRNFAAPHQLTSISPRPEAGRAYLPMTTEDINVIDITLEKFVPAITATYHLVVSDAATGDSWRSNDTFIALLDRLPLLLAVGGTLIAKVSNYTLGSFSDVYAEAYSEFEVTMLCKPTHSRIHNTEAYFVGKGYRLQHDIHTDLPHFLNEQSRICAEWYVTGNRRLESDTVDRIGGGDQNGEAVEVPVQVSADGGDEGTVDAVVPACGETRIDETDAASKAKAESRWAQLYKTTQDFFASNPVQPPPADGSSSDSSVSTPTTVQPAPVIDAPKEVAKPQKSRLGSMFSSMQDFLTIADEPKATIRRIYTDGANKIDETEEVFIGPRVTEKGSGLLAPALYASQLVVVPPGDANYPERSYNPMDKSFTCCVYFTCQKRAACCVHKVCTLPIYSRPRCLAHARCTSRRYNCREQQCTLAPVDSDDEDKADDARKPDADDKEDEPHDPREGSSKVRIGGQDPDSVSNTDSGIGKDASRGTSRRVSESLSQGHTTGTPTRSMSVTPIPEVVPKTKKTGLLRRLFPKSKKKSNDGPSPVHEMRVVKTNVKTVAELEPLMRAPAGDYTSKSISVTQLGELTDRAAESGQQQGFASYGLVLAITGGALLRMLHERGMVSSEFTTITGHRGYNLQKPDHDGCTRRPKVIVVNTKTEAWDAALQFLLRQITQQLRVVPTLVDVIPEDAYTGFSAALRLQPGVRYTFVRRGSMVPMQLQHLMNAADAELKAAAQSDQLMRLFPKTSYNEGVRALVPISECTTAYEKAICAADEYMQIQESYRRYLEPTLVDAAAVLLGENKDMDKVLKLIDQGFNVIDLETQRQVYETNAKVEICALSCAYANGKFYQANDKGEFEGTGKAIICRETLLLFDLAFIKLYKDVKIGKQLAEFFWLNGPPGCGKTYMIERNFDLNTMVLTATTAGRDDIRSKLYDSGFGEEVDDYIRTVASAVMNPHKLPRVMTVLVDEATMVHPGQLVFLAARMPVIERFVLIGDVNQIPFIDRLRMGNVQYHRAADVCMRLPDLSVTRRCPANVVFALQERYPGLKTTSEIHGTVEVVRNLADVPTLHDRLYMTFTQAEKAELKNKIVQRGSKNGPTVLTVAEAQGQTFDHTIVYRSNINKIPLFDDIAQVTTAFTRHRRSLTYYTAYAEDDTLTKWMRKASVASIEDMRPMVQLVPEVDEERTALYRRAGLDILASPATTNVTTMEKRTVSRDFCLPAGRKGSSSSRVIGRDSKSRNTSHTSRRSIGCAQTTQMRVGGYSSTTEATEMCFSQDPQLSVHRSNESREEILPNADNNTDKPAPTTEVAVLEDGLGHDLTTPVATMTSQQESERLSSTHLLELNKRKEDERKSKHTSIRSQLQNNEANDSHPLSTVLKDVGDLHASRKAAGLLTNSTVSTNPIGTQKISTLRERVPRQEQLDITDLVGNPETQSDISWPGCERFKRALLHRTALPDDVKQSLDKQLSERRTVTRRRPILKCAKSKAKAYTAEEVYWNVESVMQDIDKFEDQVDELEMLSELPVTPAVTGVPSVQMLQDTYDSLFPATVGIDYTHDAQLVEESDLQVELGPVVLDTGAPLPDPKNYDMLNPRLRTMVSSRRPMSQTELLLGFQKRNANVPRISSGLLPKCLADVAFDNFIESTVGDKELFASFADSPLSISEENFEEWVKKQPNEAVQRYLSRSDLTVDVKATNLYSYMIKAAVKPPVKNSEATTYQSVQTIAAAAKSDNALFSPVFIKMMHRWQRVLKGKYKYYTRLSPKDFEKMFNGKFNVAQLFGCERVENDISKYDKSMGPWYLMFETRLYAALGMPEWLVDIWYNSHVVSTYSERESGFKVLIHFQRRSGDASTFFGNTLINHCAAMAIYDDDKLECGVFAGDDAILFGRDISYDSSGAYADTFNFESKTFSHYKYPYFCGKFLIPTENGIYFVPDPIKTLTKWGRRDLRNFDHVRQYYVSCRDGLEPLNNEHVVDGMCDALSERYGTDAGDYENLIRTMLAFTNSEEDFLNLFYEKAGGKYIQDPSLPDTDM